MIGSRSTQRIEYENYLPNILFAIPTESSRRWVIEPKFNVSTWENNSYGVSATASELLRKMENIKNDSSSAESPHLEFSHFLRSSTLKRVSPNSGLYERQILLLESQILSRLEADPVEDGSSHPAEDIISTLIENLGIFANDWIFKKLSTDCWGTSIKAEFLHLLARQYSSSKDWRCRVVQLCLSSPCIELRDSAIRAIETWDDVGLITCLQAHKEQCTWLADYIQRVIQDLEDY